MILKFLFGVCLPLKNQTIGTTPNKVVSYGWAFLHVCFSFSNTHTQNTCTHVLLEHELTQLCWCSPTDSPGVPPSANAHHLFRGFSFVASSLVQEPLQPELHKASVHPIVQVTPTSPWVGRGCARLMLGSADPCGLHTLRCWAPRVGRWQKPISPHTSSVPWCSSLVIEPSLLPLLLIHLWGGRKGPEKNVTTDVCVKGPGVKSGVLDLMPKCLKFYMPGVATCP
jgi:hypothetical protein